MNLEYPEGATPLDPDEIDGLKHGYVTTRQELDELEQANVEEGLRWLARQKNPEILDDLFIRELHKRLFGEVWEWAGLYRRTEINIGVDPSRVPTGVRSLLEDVKYWAENRIHTPLEAAAYFHHRLVQVHPFPNGNGRHARIAADAMLHHIYAHGPIDWADSFDLQSDNRRRQAYISALREADAGRYEQLLLFVGAA